MGAAEGAWREWRPKIVEEPPLEAPPWLSFAWTDAAKRRRDCTSLQTVKKAHLEARVWSDVEEMEDLRRLLREHRRELVEQLEQLKGRREALAGYMAARRAAQDEARAAKAAAREVRQHAKAAKGAAKAAAKAAKEAAQTNADEAISGLATATGVSHERAVQVIQGASAAQRVRPVKDAEPQVAVPAFAAFQEHAPGAMASLFRNDFLVGSGRGKQALQWLARFLGEETCRPQMGWPAGCPLDYRARFVYRFGRLLPVMFQFYNNLLHACRCVERAAGREIPGAHKHNHDG